MPDIDTIGRWRRCCGRVLLAGLMLCGAAARAEHHDADFSLRGFGTLGAVRTTSDELEFVRDLSQARGATTGWDARVDSVLGVQANWRITPQVEAVVQGVSRYRYDRTFRPEIAWAFVKYDPTPALTLRGGRLGTEFFMLADSRLVGYSYLTVRPVGDFFWHLPFSSIDGGDVALTVPLGEAVVRGKLFYGLANTKLPLADRQWDIGGSPMAGGHVEYQSDAWQLRASYANIVFKNDLPLGGLGLSPEGLAHLAVDGKRSDYYSLAALYERGPWQFQLMLNHIVQHSNAFESSDGGYVLAGYRIGALTPYLGYSRVYSRPRDNTLGDPTVAAVMRDSHLDQRTTIAGVRWDVMPNVALKAQWDGIRGDGGSLFPYRNDPADRRWSGRMDVYSVTLDFIF
jgi:hypothetical protein